MQIGLTEAQLAARSKWIGASEAQRIMTGDLRALWREKTGRAKPKKIMSDWDRALKAATETLQLNWYEHKTGRTIYRRGESVTSEDYPFMGSTLDGLIAETQEPIDAKHVSMWTKGDAIQWCVDHYTWQMQHQMIVCRATKSYLTIMVGDREPVLQPIEFDPFAAEELIAACRSFWKFIEDDVEPEGDGPAYGAPPVEIQRLRNIDLGGDRFSKAWSAIVEKYNWANEVADQVAEFMLTDAQAKRHAMSREAIKKIVPDDVGELRRGKFLFTRNKAGAVTMKLEGKDG